MIHLRYISKLDSYEHYYMLSKALNSELCNSDMELYNRIGEAKEKLCDTAPNNFYEQYNEKINENYFRHLIIPEGNFIRELVRFIKSKDYEFSAFKAENKSPKSDIHDEDYNEDNEDYNEEEGDNDMEAMETYLENKEVDSKDTINHNKNLFDKKFIITQDGISLPLYFKKDWDYEVLDVGTDGKHSITITVSPDNQTKTIVIGKYLSTEVNVVLQDLISFIYSEKEYVFQMPINEIVREKENVVDLPKESTF